MVFVRPTIAKPIVCGQAILIYKIMLCSPREIEKQLSKAQDWSSNGKTDVSGMTYEEGVESALRWALGEEDSEPIENEYSEDDE